jgi:hypothetical protein
MLPSGEICGFSLSNLTVEVPTGGTVAHHPSTSLLLVLKRDGYSIRAERVALDSDRVAHR